MVTSLQRDRNSKRFMSKTNMSKTKNYFKEVDLKVSFPDLEKELLAEWYKSGVVDKYLHRNKDSNKYFSFEDGPITANNPMGVHHAWGRTYKDLWQRYKNMQGFKQRFQNGFDCQGLWVEVEVEKELGLHNKKDIENLVPGDKKASLEKFINLCKERVLRFSDIQTQQTKRLGNFMDWENSYFTMGDENNYMIWHFLKTCADHNLIYKGHDSVPWCPRCGTAISQHEMLTEDYKELTHETVYFKLPLRNSNEKEYLLVWTTTPWTIPANVAVAVDKDKQYTKYPIDNGKKFVWVMTEAKERLIKSGILPSTDVIMDTLHGAMLVGREYDAAFDLLPRVQKAMDGQPHRVIATDTKIMPISADEGTGLVHIAPGAGEEDFKLAKASNLPIIEVIDEEANYYSEMNEFAGKNAKKHPELVIDYLKNGKSGFLLKTVPITHRYPACWRCKTELVWRVVDEWYISMDKPFKGKKSLRKLMVEVTKKINWMPEFGLKRELDWLKNMHDWLISKKRYWGLALPIWECTDPVCGHFQVLDGKEELKEKAVSGWKEFDGHSPHRPWVDEVIVKCDKCGTEAKRIPDVGNPWLDAGIVPYSTISKDNKSESLYKVDKKEWEKWFPVDFITESFPGQFKNWFYSLLTMSTVLEEREPFKNVLGFASLLAEDGRPMHKSWGNSIEFNEGADKIGADVMRWIYARQNPAENLLFGYKLSDEIRKSFYLKIWNVYNFFVTYANLANWQPNAKSQKSDNVLDRWILVRLNEVVKISTENLDKFNVNLPAMAIEDFVEDLSNWYIRRSRDRNDKESLFSTTYRVLVTLSKLLAPLMPFISDLIYTNLTKEESVHLADWPKTEILSDEDIKILREMQEVRQIVEMAHALRKENNIPVRQPLKSITIKNHKLILDEYAHIISEELNIKEGYFTTGKGEMTVELDTEITPELKAEGDARQLVRQIQDARKDLKTALDELVEVTLPEWPEEFESYIKKQALVKNLKKGEFKVGRISS